MLMCCSGGSCVGARWNSSTIPPIEHHWGEYFVPARTHMWCKAEIFVVRRLMSQVPRKNEDPQRLFQKESIWYECIYVGPQNWNEPHTNSGTP
jgi:hypothetical protein